MAAPVSAQVTVGNATNGNCFPFGCASTGANSRYQQAYDASAFAGPLSFNTLTFFIYPGYSNQLNGGTFTFYLSTTSAAVSSLSSTFNDNVGSDNALFGVFTLGGAAPSELVFTGNTFNYDPLHGNLLLDIYMNITDPRSYDGSSSLSYYQSEGPGVVVGRMHDFDLIIDPRVGLVTRFSLRSDTSVPEPATALLVLTGVAGLVVTGRRRLS